MEAYLWRYQYRDENQELMSRAALRYNIGLMPKGLMTGRGGETGK